MDVDGPLAQAAPVLGVLPPTNYTVQYEYNDRCCHAHYRLRHFFGSVPRCGLWPQQSFLRSQQAALSGASVRQDQGRGLPAGDRSRHGRAAKEMEAIANNPAPPTFENTIVALEKSGQLLNRVCQRVLRRRRRQHQSHAAEGPLHRGAQARCSPRRHLPRTPSCSSASADLQPARIRSSSIPKSLRLVE